jgi:hypothetical protein
LQGGPPKPHARKRWLSRFATIFIPTILVSFVFIVGHFFGGPTGDVPALDPVEKINREADGLPVNAGPLYRNAIEVFVPTDEVGPDDLKRLDELDVRARFEAHLSRNDACLAHIEAATRLSGCLFKVARDDRGIIEPPDILVLRDVARLLQARLGLGISDRDLQRFERTLAELTRMGEHLTAQPTPFAYLIGLGALGAVQEKLLDPFVWAELSDAERHAYADRTAALCTPPPNLTVVLRFSRDELCWPTNAEARPERIAGEIDRYMAPLLKLADLPVEEQARTDHPVRLEMLKLWEEKPSSRDVIRNLAAERIPLLRKLVNCIDLRARVIAVQRGNLTAASIHQFKHANGEWPADLSPFGPLAVDIYCGQPLAYSISGDSFLLYSRGLDCDDDGGRHDGRFGGSPYKRGDVHPAPPPDGDYVFWPLSARSGE